MVNLRFAMIIYYKFYFRPQHSYKIYEHSQSFDRSEDEPFAFVEVKITPMSDYLWWFHSK